MIPAGRRPAEVEIAAAVDVDVAAAVDDELVPVAGEVAQVGVRDDGAIGLEAVSPCAGDEQPAVRQPVDRPAEAAWPVGDDLAVAVEVDGDDLVGPPMGEPQPAVMPAWRLDVGESAQEDSRLRHSVRTPGEDLSERHSRAFHSAFAVSAASGSASRSWATNAVAFAGPFASNVTLTRVGPSPQSKRATLPGCEARSDIDPSVSHCPRVRVVDERVEQDADRDADGLRRVDREPVRLLVLEPHAASALVAGGDRLRPPARDRVLGHQEVDGLPALPLSSAPPVEEREPRLPTPTGRFGDLLVGRELHGARRVSRTTRWPRTR